MKNRAEVSRRSAGACRADTPDYFLSPGSLTQPAVVHFLRQNKDEPFLSGTDDVSRSSFSLGGIVTWVVFGIWYGSKDLLFCDCSAILLSFCKHFISHFKHFLLFLSELICFVRFKCLEEGSKHGGNVSLL
ncbi:hypothetical protein EXN66_Car014450 [Channa argus]|uniref:Uncharacterized protein n=1 Tax=Channa argus TaxID=215402 RepID=A0A6G1Q8V7_CHAAH|nr:hypothetical protein EXN66_Car014450 [Channa argus]